MARDALWSTSASAVTAVHPPSIQALTRFQAVGDVSARTSRMRITTRRAPAIDPKVRAKLDQNNLAEPSNSRRDSRDRRALWGAVDMA